MTDLKTEVQHIETIGKDKHPNDQAESPRFASRELFAAANEIRIDHNGSIYTLRITRTGGLILNK